MEDYKNNKTIQCTSDVIIYSENLTPEIKTNAADKLNEWFNSTETDKVKDYDDWRVSYMLKFVHDDMKLVEIWLTKSRIRG